MKLNKINQYLSASTFAVAALAALPTLAADYKHVAVAPSDMAAQALGSTQAKSLFSHSTMLPVRAADFGKNQTIERMIDIDGEINGPLLLLSPNAGQFSLKLSDASGKVLIDEAQNIKPQALQKIAVGPQQFDGKQYAINAAQNGSFKLELSYHGKLDSKALEKDVLGYVLFKGNSDLQAVSHLNSHFTTQDNDFALVAYMVNASDAKGNREQMVSLEPALGVIDSVKASVKSPSGKTHYIRLNDLGINGDKLAGDGRYSATMPSDEIGVYITQVQYQGHQANGKAFTRTTTDIYPIAAKSFEFGKGFALIKPQSGTKAVIEVPVKQLDDSNEVHLSAELWGTDVNGEQHPAAWVGGITQPQTQKGATKLALNFDTRWLSLQGLSAPYSLKSVKLQTVDGNVPLAVKTQMSAKGFGLTKPSMTASAQQLTISDDMLVGTMPAKQQSATLGSGSKLLLVHGYCSGQAWLESHFYNAVEFKDYKQNISHNTFAQRVRNFGSSYNSYGIVAHSQGGAAALELYTKYWSGLDNASSGRLIQSVGTPYQGTALAGNLAAIGDVFGAGCGTNTDLTYNGASNWLSTIPTWARAKVNYYTTSFTDNWWSYDYCHLATDLFLDDPEDGTTEKWSGQLSGATNRGHKTGQCHTSGMRDPQQTRDTGRNSTMSSNAAR